MYYDFMYHPSSFPNIPTLFLLSILSFIYPISYLSIYVPVQVQNLVQQQNNTFFHEKLAKSASSKED